MGGRGSEGGWWGGRRGPAGCGQGGGSGAADVHRRPALRRLPAARPPPVAQRRRSLAGLAASRAALIPAVPARSKAANRHAPSRLSAATASLEMTGTPNCRWSRCIAVCAASSDPIGTGSRLTSRACVRTSVVLTSMTPHSRVSVSPPLAGPHTLTVCPSQHGFLGATPSGPSGCSGRLLPQQQTLANMRPPSRSGASMINGS